MESMIKETGTVKGVEVLFFEEAEVQKMKGDTTSFAAIGPLYVLYFKDYDRFVIQLNDWKYPLLRRLSITTTSDGLYVLPALNGFTFHLRINSIPSESILKNFETILMNNSRFSMKGQDAMLTKLEKSPDDKLSRKKGTETSFMDKVSATAHSIIDSIKAKTETIKASTKSAASTKKRSNLKDIKNKDFKKTAHSTFKKDFFQSHEKMTTDFLTMRRENPNLSHAMEFAELRKATKAPAHFVHKEELENSILNNKDIVMTM